MFFPQAQGHVLENALLVYALCQAKIGFILASSPFWVYAVRAGDPFAFILVDFWAFFWKSRSCQKPHPSGEPGLAEMGLSG